MSAFTNFLNLFKWDIQTDGEEEFDIDKALNENWDKIDAKYGVLNSKISENLEEINELKNNAILKDSDIKDNVANFTQHESRTNIVSGEKVSNLFGKIAKYFSDLKDVAFTGSYNDLLDKPDISGAINKQVTVELTSTIQANTNYTIPLNYKAGNNSLEIFYCDTKLKKRN